MKEECLICKAPLEYLEIDVPLWLAAMLHKIINALENDAPSSRQNSRRFPRCKTATKLV